MSALLYFITVISYLSFVANGGTRLENKVRDLFVYRQAVNVAYELLENECPELVRQRRSTYDDRSLPFHLEITKLVYHRLVNSLINCRENTSASDLEDTSTPTSVAGHSLVTRIPTPSDCQHFYELGARRSGVYLIDPAPGGIAPFQAWCDFFNGSGWTVFQKRFNGEVDFNCTWKQCKEGFGDVYGEHWLGLDKIHHLTQSNSKLNILLTGDDGTTESGTWASFQINDEDDKYRLLVTDDHEGELGDGLSYHDNMMFSTKDQDNDLTDASFCAISYGGPWWHRYCRSSNLNGMYRRGYHARIVWPKSFSGLIAGTVMRLGRN